MLQIGAASFYYKLVEKLLQIGAASLLQIGLLKIGAAIKNQCNCYYKIGKLWQIGAKFITNWGKYYKLGQLLQIGS